MFVFQWIPARHCKGHCQFHHPSTGSHPRPKIPNGTVTKKKGNSSRCGPSRLASWNFTCWPLDAKRPWNPRLMVLPKKSPTVIMAPGWRQIGQLSQRMACAKLPKSSLITVSHSTDRNRAAGLQLRSHKDTGDADTRTTHAPPSCSCIFHLPP